MVCGWRWQCFYCSFSVLILTDAGNSCSEQVRGEFLSVTIKAICTSFGMFTFFFPIKFYSDSPDGSLLVFF